MSPRPVAPRSLWWLAAGFAVWSSALLVLYVLHTVGCAFTGSPGPLRLGLVLVLVAHLAALGRLWLGFAREPIGPACGETGIFLHWAVIATVIAAFAATLLTLGPPLALTLCV